MNGDPLAIALRGVCAAQVALLDAIAAIDDDSSSRIPTALRAHVTDLHNTQEQILRGQLS